MSRCAQQISREWPSFQIRHEAVECSAITAKILPAPRPHNPAFPDDVFQLSSLKIPHKVS